MVLQKVLVITRIVGKPKIGGGTVASPRFFCFYHNFMQDQDAGPRVLGLQKVLAITRIVGKPKIGGGG